jgi:ATP-binding cassette subfamily B multidrug efflux pump
MEDKKRPPIKFGGGPMGMANAPEKAKNFKKTMIKILGYLRPYWLRMLMVIVFAVVSTVFTIAAPKILGRMTDDIIKGIMSQVGINFGNIASIGFWLIGLYVISAIFSYSQNWLMAAISQKVTYSFRRDISKKVARLPLNYFDKHENGDVISRVTNDVETISQNLNQSMTQLISSLIMIVGILIMMLTISWQLTLIAILVLPTSMVFISLIIKQSQKHYAKQQAALGEIDGHVDEMFSNHAIIRAFNGEDRSIDKFVEINNRLKVAGLRNFYLV